MTLSIDTRESVTRLDPLSKNVEGIDVSTSTSYGRAARIKLRKQGK